MKRFFAFIALVFASSTVHAEPRKLIIDDDGFSIMHLMLLGGDAVEVMGITSVTGNMWANRCAAYALRGLELIDRTDIPVAAGAMYPLLNTEAQTERWEALYGKLIWKGVWMKEWVEETIQEAPAYYSPNDPVEIEWGNPTTTVVPEHAAQFLINQVRAHPGEITIIAGGPLTNLALAQRLDPQFASLAKELIYMGASFNPRQRLNNQVAAEFAREFVNSPRREFNIRLDPEAANIVSRAPWRKITIIPVDPSTSTQLTPRLLAKAAAAVPSAMGEVMQNWQSGFPLWDEIAAGIWLDPRMIESSETLHVDYNVHFGPSYGDTLSWHTAYAPGLGEQPANVVKAVDPYRLESLLIKSLRGISKKER